METLYASKVFIENLLRRQTISNFLHVRGTTSGIEVRMQKNTEHSPRIRVFTCFFVNQSEYKILQSHIILCEIARAI